MMRLTEKHHRPVYQTLALIKGKMKKIIIPIILLIILFTSCKKKVYLTDEQKALLLYDVGDKFALVKNDTDTLNFEVTKKEFEYVADIDLSKLTTYYEEGLLEYYTEDVISQITISSRPQTDRERNIVHTFMHWGTNDGMYLTRYKKTSDYYLDGIRYKDCYLLTSSYYYDSMYVSTNTGILYIKSQNGDEYKLLKK